MPFGVDGEKMAKININLDSLKPKREWKRHKVQPGSNVYRVLPPFGDAANGYPYRKWMVAWGLIDPESGRMRPFASSLTTEKRCPIAEYVETLTQKAEELKSAFKAKGMSDNEIKERLKDLNAVIGRIRPKTVYAYNAINKAGEVGILELKPTAHKKLKTHMMKYINDYAQDPTSLNSDNDDSGVWFDFSRTGEKFDTEYDVVKLQIPTKNAQGRQVFEDDRSALPASVVQNYESLAYDVGALYQVKSYDELKVILLANIRDLARTVPEAVVPGFDDFSGVPTITGAAAAPATRVTRIEEDDAAPAAPAKGTKKVNLNILDDDDDQDLAPAPKQTAKPAASKANSFSNDDDVFAMADEILAD